ncbi:hypothetical protein AnigIFM59636_001473 [Aspergillus niger]|nr:hypothetical protein AnigIFM59636_001473 [Aspergillus niger]
MARPASTTVSTFVAAQTLAIDETKDIGDFVSTEDEELEIEVTAEPWGKYDPTELREVFYPIHLGEILNERDLSTNSVLYSHVSCEAIAKGVGSPSQRWDYAPR